MYRRVKFVTPCNIYVTGPTGSGKTVFVSRLLRDIPHYFSPAPKQVHYCYGADQPMIRDVIAKMKHVKTHDLLPDLATLKRWFRGKPGILVLDDMMREIGSDPEASRQKPTRSSREPEPISCASKPRPNRKPPLRANAS